MSRTVAMTNAVSSPLDQLHEFIADHVEDRVIKGWLSDWHGGRDATELAAHLLGMEADTLRSRLALAATIEAIVGNP